MKTICTAALVSTCLLAGAAQAAPVTVDYQTADSTFGTEGYYSKVRIESWGYSGDTNAGRFQLTSSALGDFAAFCVDLAQGLADGHEYSDTPSLFGSDIIDNIDRLFTSSYDAIVDGITAAAFQVALWEVVSDTATGLDLDAGTFYTYQDASGTEDNAAVETVAEGFLAGLSTAETGGFDLTFLFSETSQDVVTAKRVEPMPAVPLPAGGILLLTGLLGLVAAKRRKV